MANSPLINEKVLEELTAKLREEKKTLEQELARFAEKNPDVEGDWRARYSNLGDEWDENAQEVADFATRLPLERTLEERLKKVSQALERIEAENYGFCEADGQPISLDRLRANPATTTCLDHAH